MTDHDLQNLMTTANPLTAEAAAGLPLADAQVELLASLLAEDPTGEAPAPRAPRRLFPRVGLALAVTAAVLIALLTLNDGPGHHGSGTAWAAEQVRFAEASPLVLLHVDGWRVDYADEQSAQEGELHFRNGPTPPPQTINGDAAANTPVPADTQFAQLNWRGGGIESWDKDRGADAAASSTGPVLGTTAHIYQYQGGTPGHRDITALFRYDGRVLEFRAGAADIDAFKVLLASLTAVDTNAWLSAMPASVIKTSDRSATIDEMLKGIPLPPGFQATDIKGADLTKDRYQLGAAVSGTVACQWFKRWADARNAGDTAGVNAAIAALNTARDWPVLKEMTKEGDYPEVLLDYVKALPSGRWYGRPLTGDVNPGLGCDSLGVKLPK